MEQKENKKEKVTVNDIFENIRKKHFNENGDPIKKEGDLDEMLQDDVDNKEKEKALKINKNEQK